MSSDSVTNAHPFPQPLKFNLSKRLYFAGQTIAGSVDLDVALAQQQGIDSVRVRLRGLSKTIVSRSADQGYTTQIIPVYRCEETLWTPGSAYPAPGSHVIRLPFAFDLPTGLPPSFYTTAFGDTARISYSVEVLGHRQGLLQRSRRLGTIFPLLPSATPEQIITRSRLLAGWDGEWKTLYKKAEIRKGIWGSCSQIDSELRLPLLQSYPIGTPLPFRLRITTTTPEIKHGEMAKQQGKGKELFPAPPTNFSDITFRLCQFAKIKVDSLDASTFAQKDNLIPPGTHINVEDPVWIPRVVGTAIDESSYGKLSRSVSIDFKAAVNSVPSFKSATIEYRPIFRLYIVFKGGSNPTVTHDWGVEVNSGFRPPPPIDQGGDFHYGSANPPPSPENIDLDLDLPPSYWQGQGHNWDFEDEKA